MILAGRVSTRVICPSIVQLVFHLHNPTSRANASRVAILVGYTLREVKMYARLEVEPLPPKLNQERLAQVFSSFIGFCTSNLAQQNFISRAAMLEQVQAGQISLSDERLGLNYGRAAISLLAQLVPYINIQASGTEIFCLVRFSILSSNFNKNGGRSSAIQKS